MKAAWAAFALLLAGSALAEDDSYSYKIKVDGMT
jgi:hypothetical protein